jgi:RHS repeat-associated protein
MIARRLIEGEAMASSRRRSARRRMNCLGVVFAMAIATGHAQTTALPTATATRTSAFEYDAATGLLKAEVVEPGMPDLCVRTEYTLDGYGNRVTSTVKNCSGASGAALFTVRSTKAAYASHNTTAGGATYVVPAGTFIRSATNAKGQSETREHDPRFGSLSAQSGPNGLTTRWYYDDFGRKSLEIAPDGNRTVIRHCVISGQGDTSANSAGCATPAAKPALAVSYVETQPTDAAGTAIGAYSRKYSDALGRVIREETQGFDGAGQPAGARTIVKDTEYNPFGGIAKVSQPYFIDNGGASLPTAGAAAGGWSATEYDALGRPVAIHVRDNEGNSTYAGATVAKASFSYSGLTVTETRIRTSRNAAGQQQAAASLTTTRISNPLGQVVEIRDAAGATLRKRHDPFGNITETQDALDNRIVTTFDLRGRKTALKDPNAGQWLYGYDALGQLKTQQSPTQSSASATTIAYDELGRISRRTEPEYSTTWTYDSCLKGVGKLCQTVTSNGQTKTHTYDSYGRPSTTSQAVTGGPTFTATTRYDSRGRVASYTYPTGVELTYGYTALGYLSEVRQGATLQWKLNTANAWGKPDTFELAGGTAQATRHTHDPVTGRVLGISAGAGGAIMAQTYGWDTVGNLTDRSERYDASNTLSENFAYDSLNRLASYETSSPGLSPQPIKTVSLSYNAIGNITSKSDVGTYSYPASGVASTRPGAVSQVTGGPAEIGTRSYTYDAAGNMTGAAGNGRFASVSYTSFNLPVQLSGREANYSWAYGADHERVRETRSGSRTTYYFHPDNANGLAFEQERYGPTVINRHYVSALGRTFLVMESTGEVSAKTAPGKYQYWHTDQLGSVVAVTAANGTVKKRLSYDPFGKRRQITGAYDPAGNLIVEQQGDSSTDRGFTGHEHLDDVGIIHMNGRTYDPVIGRFMQADPRLQAPDQLQNYNRYSYVLNNPLNATDPTGEFIFAVFAYAFYQAAGQIMVAQGLLAATCTARMTFAQMAVAASISAGITAAMQGADEKGVLRSAAAGGFGVFAFNAVGTAGDWHKVYLSPSTNFTEWMTKNVAHAAVGCAQASMGGGKCRAGAIGAGVSSALGFAVDDADASNKDVVRAVIGGVASQVAGGKFLNGAFTAAFGYLANDDFGNEGTSPEDSAFGGGNSSGYTMFGLASNEVMFATELAAGVIGSFGATEIGAAKVGLSAKGLLEGANFAQKTFSPAFSKGGTFAGQSVADVAGALRSGAMKPADVPINYIIREGQVLILNTRSAQALQMAGIPRGQWSAVNRTGQGAYESMLNRQLQRNGLTSKGISTVRQSGSF